MQQLAAMDDRYGRAVRARDFASPTEEPAAACRLYTAEGLAQVDEVGTLERRRGRGHATAAVLAAVDAARAEGADPIFLLTDAADWPQQLYATARLQPDRAALRVPQAAPRRARLTALGLTGSRPLHNQGPDGADPLHSPGRPHR